jgi:hypothetical protein
MRKQSSIHWAAMTVLIIATGGCIQEPIQVQNSNKIICEGCPDPVPGDGTVAFPPAISSFTPQRGIVGTTVILSGGDFSSTPSFNIVKFDGVQAQVVTATTGKLSVVVPQGATSGKITVAVSGLQGTSLTNFQVIDIPLSGLVAFYPFDGNANDISSNKLHGTPNGPTLSTDRLGNTNRAFSFDGVNDFITMGNTPALGITNSMTILLWTNLSQFENGAGLISKINAVNVTGTENVGYEVTTDNTPYFGYKVFIGYPGFGLTGLGFGSRAPIGGGWFCFAFTIENSKAIWYLNGSRWNSVTNHQPLTSVSATNFLVGKGRVGKFFNGKIDDIVIYNRALTAAEITKLYEQPILP